jgi:hypothetical protein
MPMGLQTSKSPTAAGREASSSGSARLPEGASLPLRERRGGGHRLLTAVGIAAVTPAYWHLLTTVMCPRERLHRTRSPAVTVPVAQLGRARRFGPPVFESTHHRDGVEIGLTVGSSIDRIEATAAGFDFVEFGFAEAAIRSVSK